MEQSPEAMAALQQLMQPPPRPATRDPRLVLIEDFMAQELMARHKREDLAPPESLLDTPTSTNYPILEKKPPKDLLGFGGVGDLGQMFNSAMGALGEQSMGPSVDPLAALMGAGEPQGMGAPPVPPGLPPAPPADLVDPVLPAGPVEEEFL